MTKQNILNPIYTILLVFACLKYCYGQVNSNTQNIKVTEINASSIGQPLLSKTQGSSQYGTISCGIQDKNGNLWFGTSEEGVYKYDGTSFTQFTKNEGLNSNCVKSIMEDKSGNIWFGTCDGICRLDSNKIVSVPINSNVRPVISNNNYYNAEWSTKNTVWSMLQDKSGKIWFGTGDGVYSYDGLNFKHFLSNDGVINKDSLHLKIVADIKEDKNGNIWFFSGMLPGSEGICRYDGKMIERYKPREFGWNRNAFFSQNGNLIVATRNYGIWTYDGNSFSDYIHPFDIVKPSINQILEDKAGKLWIASDYGYEMDDKLGGLWYSNNPTSSSAEATFTKIYNNEVYFMLENKDNHIWFSTRNMGLYRYDGNTLTNFSK